MSAAERRRNVNMVWWVVWSFLISFQSISLFFKFLLSCFSTLSPPPLRYPRQWLLDNLLFKGCWMKMLDEELIVSLPRWCLDHPHYLRADEVVLIRACPRVRLLFSLPSFSLSFFLREMGSCTLRWLKNPQRFRSLSSKQSLKWLFLHVCSDDSKRCTQSAPEILLYYRELIDHTKTCLQCNRLYKICECLSVYKLIDFLLRIFILFHHNNSFVSPQSTFPRDIWCNLFIVVLLLSITLRA